MIKLFKYFYILAWIIFSAECFAADSPATGEWKYMLLLNGTEIGYAVIANKTDGNNFVSSSEYCIKFSNVTSITKDTVIETNDFKPVKLVSYSKITAQGKTQETNIVSLFNGRNVEVTFGGKKSSYTLNRDFIIDGNFYLSQAMKSGFRPGFEAVNYVYNPAVELDTPIKAVTKVVGYETINIKGKELKLIHLVQSIENIKDNIDLFVDENCVLQKGIIHMLNMKIEIIKN